MSHRTRDPRLSFTPDQNRTFEKEVTNRKYQRGDALRSAASAFGHNVRQLDKMITLFGQTEHHENGQNQLVRSKPLAVGGGTRDEVSRTRSMDHGPWRVPALIRLALDVGRRNFGRGIPLPRSIILGLIELHKSEDPAADAVIDWLKRRQQWPSDTAITAMIVKRITDFPARLRLREERMLPPSSKSVSAIYAKTGDCH